MRKLVQLPRFQELEPLLVMNYVFDELTSGFKHWGFEVRIVTRKEDLEDGGILFLDDYAYRFNKNIINEIAKLCPNSVCICWYWLDTNFKPFQYIIHTGEYNLMVPTNSTARQRHLTYMTIPTFVPIVFRPNELPENIGTYPRNVVRDYCFMGAPYKPDWVPSSPEFNGIYHTGDWSKYLSYDKRREIYLSSTFALGFHDPIAVESGSISARIFEGLSYGCVVFCESEFVCKYTDGIVVHIKSKEDLEEKMRYYKTNPELIKEKQIQGYNWMRTKGGTNIHSCLLFLQKIKEFYNIIFE
jgi:hypothetical protein